MAFAVLATRPSCRRQLAAVVTGKEMEEAAPPWWANRPTSDPNNKRGKCRTTDEWRSPSGSVLALDSGVVLECCTGGDKLTDVELAKCRDTAEVLHVVHHERLAARSGALPLWWHTASRRFWASGTSGDPSSAAPPAGHAANAFVVDWSATCADAVNKRFDAYVPSAANTTIKIAPAVRARWAAEALLAVGTLLFAPGVSIEFAVAAAKRSVPEALAPCFVTKFGGQLDLSVQPDVIAAGARAASAVQCACIWALDQVWEGVMIRPRGAAFATGDVSLSTAIAGLLLSALRHPQSSAVLDVLRLVIGVAGAAHPEIPRASSVAGAKQVTRYASMAGFAERYFTSRRPTTPAAQAASSSCGDASSAAKVSRLSCTPSRLSDLSVRRQRSSPPTPSELQTSTSSQPTVVAKLRKAARISGDLAARCRSRPPDVLRPIGLSGDSFISSSPTEGADVRGPAAFDGWCRLPVGVNQAEADDGWLDGAPLELQEHPGDSPAVYAIPTSGEASSAALRELEEFLFVHRRRTTGDETRRDLARVFPRFGVPVRPVGERRLRLLSAAELAVASRPSL